MALMEEFMEEKEVSRLARLINDRIEELKGVKSQKDIARSVGFRTANIITMLKLGETKLALDRVPAMAKALEVDPRHMMRLAMEQFYSPQMTRTLFGFLESSVTENEMELVLAVRAATDNTDPKFSPEQIQGVKDLLV